MIKFKTLYADPPWPAHGGPKPKNWRWKGGVKNYYKTLSFEEIYNFKLSALHDDCHLYLWVINGFIPQGVETVKRWGFRYVTMLTWDKQRMGLGQYFGQQTEHIMFGVKGHPGYKKHYAASTLLSFPRRAHSQKPDEVYDLIDKASWGPRVELFARTKRRGWTQFGYELGKFTSEVEH